MIMLTIWDVKHPKLFFTNLHEVPIIAKQQSEMRKQKRRKNKSNEQLSEQTIEQIKVYQKKLTCSCSPV